MLPIRSRACGWAVAEVGWNSPMAWPVYANIKEEDLAAIYAYLMAQPPVKHAVTIVDAGK